jgi:hypothetical protein
MKRITSLIALAFLVLSVTGLSAADKPAAPRLAK